MHGLVRFLIVSPLAIGLLVESSTIQAADGKGAQNQVSSESTSSGSVEVDKLGKARKAQAYKIFDAWNPPSLKAGDCRSKAPPPPLTLTLYSDGSLHWIAQVYSGDTHDTWEGTFTFKSADDKVQGNSGAWRYHMNLSYPQIYTWDQSKAADATLAANFNLITKVTFTYSC